VAPVGYVNNLSTHRIDVDPVRGPLIAELFTLYASGKYSLKALSVKAHARGLTHPRSSRRMMKAEIYRILQNPLYHGEFLWLGTRYQGSHHPLITRATFDQVQAALHRKPRARYARQRHAFMGLLTCARCGCSMTAEQKKGKYVYYHCTDFRGAAIIRTSGRSDSRNCSARSSSRSRFHRKSLTALQKRFGRATSRPSGIGAKPFTSSIVAAAWSLRSWTEATTTSSLAHFGRTLGAEVKGMGS
jgi:recombinase/recombinase-like zinc beta ribbon protein